MNTQSNHPPLVLKQIPKGIEKRLCDISANKEIFEKAIKPYQKAIDEAGFNHKLKYSEEVVKEKPKNKPRLRPIT